MDPLTIGMLVILAVLIFFMFRNSKKRKQQQEELRAQIVPGADVMTNFGLYGKLISMDTEANEAVLETSPGVFLRVHSQTVAKVINPDEPRSVEEAQARADAELAEREAELNVDTAIRHDAPEFGERVEDTKKTDRPSGD